MEKIGPKMLVCFILLLMPINAFSGAISPYKYNQLQKIINTQPGKALEEINIMLESSSKGQADYGQLMYLSALAHFALDDKYQVNKALTSLKALNDSAYNQKANIYLKLANYYFHNHQNDSALHVLKDSLFWDKAGQFTGKKWIVLRNYHLTKLKAFRFNELTEKAVHQSLWQHHGHLSEIPEYEIYLLQGRLAALSYEFDTAFQYYHEALATCSEQENNEGLTNVFLVIGNELETHGYYNLAGNYYLKALDLIDKHRNYKLTVMVFNKLAETYYMQQNYSLVNKYTLHASEYAQRNNFKYGNGLAHILIGKTAIETSSYNIAEKSFHQAGDILNNYGNYEIIAQLLVGKIQLYHETAEMDRAKASVNELMTIWEKIKNTEFKKQTNAILTKYYLSLGNTSEALKYFNLYNESSKYINSHKGHNQLLTAHTAYSLSYSDNRLKQKQQELSKIRAQKKVQQLIIFLLIISTVVILLFMIIIYRLYRKNRNAAEQLLKKNREISQSREELLEAKEKAEESDKLKSSFLANMSHEIRTPMNSIIGFSNLLMNENISDEKRKKYFGIIQKNGYGLANLIDDIIDLSKLESNQLTLHPEKCELHSELKNIERKLKNELEAFKKPYIDLRLILPPKQSVKTCNVDFIRVKQVLANLLVNAVKFTKQGVIEFGYHYHEKQLRFFVQDTGIGIAPEAKDIIFKRFRQVDEGVSREHGGTGHGLALCKGLVELMGGKIWLDSELNKGTIFYFTVNVDEVILLPDEDTRKKFTIPNRKDIDWAGNKLLIVEDEEENYFLLKEIISETNAQHSWAKNGAKAVEMVDKEGFNAVIMDIKMPVMDGYEATRKIKKKHPNLPVIALTAFSFSGQQSECIAAGCDSYVSKPVDFDEIIQAITPFLKDGSKLKSASV